MQSRDHPPSEPSWTTLASPDPQAVVAVYQRLLGWNATWADEAADMSLDAQPVARIAPVAEEGPGWLVHIAVDDVEHSVARALDAGGSVVVVPTADVGGHIGAVLTDSPSVRFAIRAPTSRSAGGPGTFAWSELDLRVAAV